MLVLSVVMIVISPYDWTAVNMSHYCTLQPQTI